jgi:hypothetical protein
MGKMTARLEETNSFPRHVEELRLVADEDDEVRTTVKPKIGAAASTVSTEESSVCNQIL